MTQQERDAKELITPEIIARVAREWECPVGQMESLAAIIKEIGGSMVGDAYDDLTLVAVAYSTVCSTLECTGWLPFHNMPNWKDDVFCYLEDEEAWLDATDDSDKMRALVKRLRAENQKAQDESPT